MVGCVCIVVGFCVVVVDVDEQVGGCLIVEEFVCGVVFLCVVKG